MFIVIAKMSRILSLIYVAVMLLEDEVAGQDPVYSDIDSALQALDEMVIKLDKATTTPDILSDDDDLDIIYDDMSTVIEEIITAVEKIRYANKFLKAKGIERVIQRSLKTDDNRLKNNALILLEVLFDADPKAIIKVIPVTLIDSIVDIFEYDNLHLKTTALNVMHLWLPGNPKVQARVMKIKGLEPFYKQAAKLDMPLLGTLLDLFNIIIKEHLKVRNDAQRTIVDSDITKIYQRIGLLEHLKTSEVCYGLLSMFTKIMVNSTDAKSEIIVVLDMLKNIKPFCWNLYRGDDKAGKLFMLLKNYVNDPDKLEYFKSRGLNVLETTRLIDEMSRYSVKDEM